MLVCSMVLPWWLLRCLFGGYWSLPIDVVIMVDGGGRVALRYEVGGHEHVSHEQGKSSSWIHHSQLKVSSTPISLSAAASNKDESSFSTQYTNFFFTMYFINQHKMNISLFLHEYENYLASITDLAMLLLSDLL